MSSECPAPQTAAQGVKSRVLPPIEENPDASVEAAIVGAEATVVVQKRLVETLMMSLRVAARTTHLRMSAAKPGRH